MTVEDINEAKKGSNTSFKSCGLSKPIKRIIEQLIIALRQAYFKSI